MKHIMRIDKDELKARVGSNLQAQGKLVADVFMENLPEEIFFITTPSREEMQAVITCALAGHEWFDCWTSIDEAARVAVEAIMSRAILINE